MVNETDLLWLLVGRQSHPHHSLQEEVPIFVGVGTEEDRPVLYTHFTLKFYRDSEGKLRASPDTDAEVCDFCMAKDPPWTYPAAEMEIVGHPIINRSDDPWGACDLCHQLIEASDIDGLVSRMVNMQPVHMPAEYPPEAVREAAARQNVLRFMDARMGAPWHED